MSKLDNFISSLNKQMKGSVKITRAEDYDAHWADKLPFGLMSLDVATKGGSARGTVTQLHGEPGSGKDLLINMQMAAVQQKYGDKTGILWLSFGYPPDTGYMRMCGVQVAYSDQALLQQGIPPSEATDEQRGTQVGNILFVDLANTAAAEEAPAESLFTAAAMGVRSGAFQLIVINEMGSGETKDNVDKQLNENVKVGSWAMLVTNFAKRFYTAIRMPITDEETGEQERNQTNVLVANPVRANIVTGYAAKYAPSTTDTSGWALRHLKALDIHLRASKKIRVGKKVVGKEIHWKIAKAKHGVSEGAEGVVNFYFDKGVDAVADLTSVAIAHDVISRRGAKYDVPGPEQDWEVTGGKEGVVEFLREHDKIVAHIRSQTLVASFGKS